MCREVCISITITLTRHLHNDLLFGAMTNQRLADNGLAGQVEDEQTVRAYFRAHVPPYVHLLFEPIKSASDLARLVLRA